VARHGSAKPFTAVRIRFRPPNKKAPEIQGLFYCAYFRLWFVVLLKKERRSFFIQPIDTAPIKINHSRPLIKKNQNPAIPRFFNNSMSWMAETVSFYFLKNGHGKIKSTIHLIGPRVFLQISNRHQTLRHFAEVIKCTFRGHL